MAAVKKTTYINTELDWAEQQLTSWKAYVDANPLHELKDRIEWKPFMLFDKGKRDVLEIEFENGEVVVCTPEHKWYVDCDGDTIVIRADELEKYGHILT